MDFKEILKAEGINGKDISQILGLSYSSYRSLLSRGYKNGAPRWVKSFVMGYQMGKNSEEKKSDPDGL